MLNFKLKYISLLILSVPLLLMLSGCHDMTIQVTGLPENTPRAERIYISGNFNNWDPGDTRYILTRNKDSVFQVRLPRGIGEIEYKFSRGDWSTVEKDPCGFEISNRKAVYGRDFVIKDTIRSWNDLPKPNCPYINFILDSLPSGTPENAVFYIASNINGWDPGSRYWMFTKGPDGKYYIEIPRADNRLIEYKITRGDWRTVECQANLEDIDNRVYRGTGGKEVRIVVKRWKDK